jgi:hypothetical protein
MPEMAHPSPAASPPPSLLLHRVASIGDDWVALDREMPFPGEPAPFPSPQGPSHTPQRCLHPPPPIATNSTRPPRGGQSREDTTHPALPALPPPSPRGCSQVSVAGGAAQMAAERDGRRRGAPHHRLQVGTTRRTPLDRTTRRLPQARAPRPPPPAPRPPPPLASFRGAGLPHGPLPASHGPRRLHPACRIPTCTSLPAASSRGAPMPNRLSLVLFPGAAATPPRGPTSRSAAATRCTWSTRRGCGCGACAS